MSVSRISKALGYVDDELVSGAIEYKSTKKRNTWVMWGAIAACLSLCAVLPIVGLQKSSASIFAVVNIGPFIFVPVLLVSLTVLFVNIISKERKKNKAWVLITLASMNLLNILAVYLVSKFGTIRIIGSLPIILISSNVGAVVSIVTNICFNELIKSRWIKILLWLFVTVVSIFVACMAYHIFQNLFQTDSFTIA